MNKLLFAGISLALLMAACASSSPPDNDPVDVDGAPSETLPPAPPFGEGDTTLPDDGPIDERGDYESDPPNVKPLPETPPVDNDGPLERLVALAIADLMQRLSVTDTAITVVSAESVVWPDGSLGCPIPGMKYTQVQVEGTRIVLSVDGGVYDYHSGASRGPFLCVPSKDSENGVSGLTLPGAPNADD